MTSKDKHWKLSKETRKRMSKAKRGNQNAKGWKPTEEMRKKMSLAQKGKIPWIKGKHHSKRTREKMSIAKIGNQNAKGWKPTKEMIEKTRIVNIGRKHSEEAKRKISLALKGNKYAKGHKHNHSNKTKQKISLNHAKYWLGKKRPDLIFPKKDTSIEVKIQNFLKQLRIEFFTHQYIKEIKHSYRCDILIPSINMVIECDGDYWHKYPVGKEIDNVRTKELLEKGFKVLRLWERDIRKMNIENFKEILNDRT